METLLDAHCLDQWDRPGIEHELILQRTCSIFKYANQK